MTRREIIVAELNEKIEACDECEAGDPCWCCGVDERIKELKDMLNQLEASEE